MNAQACLSILAPICVIFHNMRTLESFSRIRLEAEKNVTLCTQSMIDRQSTLVLCYFSLCDPFKCVHFFLSSRFVCVCACVFKRQFFKIIPLNRKTNHDQVVEYTKEQEKKKRKNNDENSKNVVSMKIRWNPID